jgi:hypothetical protein
MMGPDAVADVTPPRGKADVKVRVPSFLIGLQ